MKHPNLKKSLNILLRLTIALLSLGFIYWKVFAGGNLHDLIDAIRHFSNARGFYPGLILIFILMLANWSVEALKWRFLMRKLEAVSFVRAVQSVLLGVTVSIFTPNRTGEFIGRVFTLKNSDPVRATLLTILGSLSQLLVTLILGSLALVFTYRQFLPAGTTIPSWAHGGVIAGVVLFNLTALAAFFNVPGFGASIKNFIQSRAEKVSRYFQVLAAVDRKELAFVLLLSITRYLIFTCQFYLMLKLFGVLIPIQAALYIIPLIYLTLAIVPTFALSELGVRGSVSLYFISTYLFVHTGIAMNETGSLAVILAAGMLWMINLAIPALWGVPFVFRLRFFTR